MLVIPAQAAFLSAARTRHRAERTRSRAPKRRWASPMGSGQPNLQMLVIPAQAGIHFLSVARANRWAEGTRNRALETPLGFTDEAGSAQPTKLALRASRMRRVNTATASG